MTDLRLSASAVRDLESIGTTGTEQFGGRAAARHLAGFERLFALIRQYPGAGAPRPELGRRLRSLSYRPHRIIYRVDDDEIVIARIVHQAQDLGGTLEDWS